MVRWTTSFLIIPTKPFAVAVIHPADNGNFFMWRLSAWGSASRLQAVQEHSRYPHLDPESPNNLLKGLGYREVLRAHGWRSLPLTAGQEVLKAPHVIIQRQMGHLIGDKVRKAYDKSLMLEERREFLEQWCKLLVKNGLKIWRHKKAAGRTKSCCDNLTLTEVIDWFESYQCTPNHFSYITRKLIIKQLSN